MFVIIVGCGSVGAGLAEALSGEGHNLVVVDQQEHAFQKLGIAFNGVTVTGNGFKESVLKEAGIEQADCLVALTDSDNANIVAAQVAQKIFNVPRVIVRVYDQSRVQVYREMGLEIFQETSLLVKLLCDWVGKKNSGKI